MFALILYGHFDFREFLKRNPTADSLRRQLGEVGTAVLAELPQH
jgi:hypothetical protein